MKKATEADIKFVIEHFDDRFRCVAPSDAVRARICELASTGLITQRWENGVEVFYVRGIFSGAITANRLSRVLQTAVFVR